jgi:hypothetical protein
MAAFIDFSSLSNDQKRLIYEMTFEKVIQNPDYNAMHDINTGIKSGDRIGFIGKGGIAMKAAQACGSGLTPQSGGSTGSSMLWTPTKWEIVKRECGTDLEHPIMAWGLKYGNDMFNSEGTEYASAVSDVLSQMVLENLWRSTWFNDTTAALVSATPAGVITAGTDITYFSWKDGLFKLLFTACAGTPARHTTFTGNNQASYALQKAVATAAATYTVLSNLTTDADMRLRAAPDKVIYCTVSCMDRYIEYLESKGQEPAWGLLINGGRSLKFRGIQMIEVPLWDDQINAYENTGTKWNLPHRALLTTKSNLKIGTQDTAMFKSIDFWHNKETRYNWMEVIGDIDIHVAETYMFQFAY